MSEITEIYDRTRVYSLSEAKSLLPIVRRVTKSAHSRIEILSAQLSFTLPKEKRTILEEQVQRLFKEWQWKIQKLGAQAKGMWIVDFDSGEGFYCWHFPEPEITYFHGYAQGFQGRIRIQ